MLVVGQYYPYKGLDVAIQAARLLPSVQFKFVGAGKRTDLFVAETGADKLENVQIVPFLDKLNLKKEYEKCRALVLPSRQECWGLVVNEAASLGIPIVSTSGSGAAVEFLFPDYACFLALPDDAEDLALKIKCVLAMKHVEKYREYLIDKAERYSLENNVRCHLTAFHK